MLSMSSPVSRFKPPQVADEVKELETIFEQEKIASESASESTTLNDIAQEAARGTERKSTERAGRLIQGAPDTLRKHVEVVQDLCKRLKRDGQKEWLTRILYKQVLVSY